MPPIQLRYLICRGWMNMAIVEYGHIYKRRSEISALFRPLRCGFVEGHVSAEVVSLSSVTMPTIELTSWLAPQINRVLFGFSEVKLDIKDRGMITCSRMVSYVSLGAAYEQRVHGD